MKIKNIRTKVLLVIATVAILGVCFVFFFSENNSRKFILEDSFSKLVAIREIKANQIETYFKDIENQVRTLSESKMVIEAFREFDKGLESLEADLRSASINPEEIQQSLERYYEQEFIPRLKNNSTEDFFASSYIPVDPQTRALQYLYISSNPEEVGEKDRLESSDIASSYGGVHQNYHSVLRSFQQKFGFYDLFLVEQETGRIVYSVFKEIDYGTSLMNGPYRESQLAKVFRNAQTASFSDYVNLVDFAPYVPSYNGPASFIASPIFDGEEKIGVLIFQMPIDRINNMMTGNDNWQETGLGESGETYLIGDDFTLRNQSRFLVESKEEYLNALRESNVPASIVSRIDNLNSGIGLQPVRTEAALSAIEGQKGQSVLRDYRGVEVLSAYGPLNISGVQWAILSEIDKSEALEPLRRLRWRFFIVIAVLIPLIILVAYVFSRSLTKRIQKLNAAALELSEGHLDVALNIQGEDEIGSLANSFEKMRRSIQDLVAKQTKTIDALTASLIPLTDDIAVMVLIGDFDDYRIGKVRSSITEGLYETPRKVVILDLSSIPHVDENTAGGLMKIAKTAQLMGCKTILTGIHPSMAIEITELGLATDGIITKSSLQSGIDEAMLIVKYTS